MTVLNATAPATPPDPNTPVTLHQEATATQDGQIDLVAGDRYTHPPRP
ncbi:hypothetical protein [Kitasatospora sp. NPDC057015]